MNVIFFRKFKLNFTSKTNATSVTGESLVLFPREGPELIDTLQKNHIEGQFSVRCIGPEMQIIVCKGINFVQGKQVNVCFGRRLVAIQNRLNCRSSYIVVVKNHQTAAGQLP